MMLPRGRGVAAETGAEDEPEEAQPNPLITNVNPASPLITVRREISSLGKTSCSDIQP